jgi:osmotically-inducible protein OsmY
MSRLRRLYPLASVLILTGAFAGCATYGNRGADGRSGDAKVTANVQALFDQHPELGAPNMIEVQTLNHVVYLHGQVSAGLQSNTAESLARETPGVANVVNSIAVTSNGA